MIFYRHLIKRLGLGLIAVLAVLWTLWNIEGRADQDFQSRHQVHVAFGFHVNLYHSFRNDTNDESGFGKDIRIIRHIIRTLDRCNAKGVPVKGVWDFDNLFSLQEILPRFAPDIIEDIRRRVRDHGDEVILMSYNNGLVSAMTPRELDDAVRWTISNPWQSGVQDIFGAYTPVVRPQEMMTTPGNFTVYKKHGVEAVALYYSATPFDTFRVFSRPLSRAEAHNPILYQHPQTGEEMVIIPSYHFGDLVEHVSLGHWVRELRTMQDRGELDRDALIFINYDADSELWQGVDLPWILEWLPNTDGIGALVREIQDMPNVHFTTLGRYLNTHAPVGTFSFSQDTADGSYDGYNSWSEKADVSGQWTIIERNRRICAAARHAMPFFTDHSNRERLDSLIAFAEMKRLRALSTTNFGMATPFVARQREQVMADLMADLDRYSEQIEQLTAEGLHLRLVHATPPEASLGRDLRRLDTLMVLQARSDDCGPQSSRFIRLPLPHNYSAEESLVLVDDSGRTIPAINLGIQPDSAGDPQLTLFMAGEQAVGSGLYHLFVNTGKDSGANTTEALTNRADITNGRLSVKFEHQTIEGIYLDGVRQTETGSLMPYAKWGDQTLQGRGITSKVRSSPAKGGAVSMRMTGSLPGPEQHTISDGRLDYQYTLIADLPYLLVQGTLVYPSTQKDDILKAASPGLIRRADLNWMEAAPVEIRFAPRTGRDAPVKVLKHNYLGVSSEYLLDYFRYSDKNLDLDNINNHITESYVGIMAGEHGMAIAMDTSVQSNFAFAPLKLRFDSNDHQFSVRANPFGTYSGRQYVPPTWGNGNGYNVTLLTGEQFAGAGPTYNGATRNFSLLLAFFKGLQMPDAVRNDLVDYANPPVVVSLHRSVRTIRPRRPLAPPLGFVAAYKQGFVQFGWDNDGDSHHHYRILCGSRPGKYETVFPATGNSLKVTRLTEGRPFIKGRDYFAVIESISANGRTSGPTAEIRFSIGEVPDKRPEIPFGIELKVLWANLQSLVTSFRL